MPKCRSCSSGIMWAINEATGNAVPLDPQPTEDGNIILVDRQKGRPVVRFLKKDSTLAHDGLRYTSHFATCPNAARHRRGSR